MHKAWVGWGRGFRLLLAGLLSLTGLTSLAMLSGCSKGALRTPAQGGKPWTVIKTDRIEVLTTLDGGKAAQVAALLHADAEALERLIVSCPRPVSPLKPARLVLLGEKREFKELISKRNVAAYFAVRWSMLSAPEPMMVMPWSEFWETGRFRHIFLHEYTHRLVSRCWPNMPTWVNEGLAEYYGTFEVHKGSAVTGTPAYVFHDTSTQADFVDRQAVVHLPFFAFLSLDALISASQQGFYDGPASRIEFRYASAWGYLHFLMSGPHKARFADFLQELALPDPPGNLWQKHFGEVDANLTQEALNYLRGDSIPIVTHPMSQTVRVKLKKSAVAELDAALLLARLFSATDADRAAQLLAGVLDKAPNHPQAVVMRADELALDGKFDAAEALLVRALSARVTPSRELLIAAGQLYTIHGKPPLERLLKHHEQLRQLARAETDSEVQNALAWSHYALNRPEKGAAALAEGLRLNPACWTCYRTRALQREAMGDWAGASRAFNSAALLVGENAAWQRRALLRARNAARAKSKH